MARDKYPVKGYRKRPKEGRISDVLFDGRPGYRAGFQSAVTAPKGPYVPYDYKTPSTDEVIRRAQQQQARTALGRSRFNQIGSRFEGLGRAARAAGWFAAIAGLFDLAQNLVPDEGFTVSPELSVMPQGHVLILQCQSRPTTCLSYRTSAYGQCYTLQSGVCGGTVTRRYVSIWNHHTTVAGQPRYRIVQEYDRPALADRVEVSGDDFYTLEPQFYPEVPPEIETQVPTWVDPLRTPGHFHPAPTAPAYRAIPHRYPNPNRSPTEQPQRGPMVVPAPRVPTTRPGRIDRPGTFPFPPVAPSPAPAPAPGPQAPPGTVTGAPSEPTMRWRSTRSLPQLRTPRKFPRRPRRREKEKKVRMGAFAARVMWVVGQVTEGLDLIDAIYAALPDELRSMHYHELGEFAPTPQDKLLWIAKHFQEIDGGKMVENIAMNWAEDEVIGRLSSAATEEFIGALESIGTAPLFGPGAGPAIGNEYGLGRDKPNVQGGPDPWFYPVAEGSLVTPYDIWNALTGERGLNSLYRERSYNP